MKLFVQNFSVSSRFSLCGASYTVRYHIYECTHKQFLSRFVRANFEELVY